MIKNNKRNGLAQQVIELSNIMLAKARAGDWEDLGEIELTRKQFLDNYFSGTVDLDLVEQTAALINSVMKIDKELVNLVTQSRQSSLDQHAHSKKIGKAVKAYNLNSK